MQFIQTDDESYLLGLVEKLSEAYERNELEMSLDFDKFDEYLESDSYSMLLLLLNMENIHKLDKKSKPLNLHYSHPQLRSCGFQFSHRHQRAVLEGRNQQRFG